MTLDTTIKNIGDYYAAHYLADKNGFAKDIGDLVKAWKGQGSEASPKRLQSLGEAYFKAKSAALDFAEPDARARADLPELSGWHARLLDALGYQPQPARLELSSEQRTLPILARLNRHNQPWLVILETTFCLPSGEEEEPLELELRETTTPAQPDQTPLLQTRWEKAIASLFTQEDRPRWALLLSGSRVHLFDAHTYAQGRYLWIDLDELFSRKQAAAFQAIAALLAAQALAPHGETDEVLHERLREGSLKSTHGVSARLQGAVREAIQAIANGWVEARRQAKLGYRSLADDEPPLPDGGREITAAQLKHDALVYVYRLLFCLYAEARGSELGILPIDDEIYRLGYSLEALRDLADRGEPGIASEQGSYFAEHLDQLFGLIYNGFHPELEEQEQIESALRDFQPPKQSDLFDDAPDQPDTSQRKRHQSVANGRVFTIQPLTATLFDPGATPLLSRVKLPNRVLHRVIRCLSLGASEQSKRVGRINYAELGIVQLGAVYEGLLSYQGFFAAEDLIQVHEKAKKPKGKPQPVVHDDAIDPKLPTWFVPAERLGEFDTGEVILEHRTREPRIYKMGEFILHLNGVDRVNSASYYTPEVLTRTQIEEGLKERLKGFGPEQADQLLHLTLCEPAMGSAAYLVEAIDQLARRYLHLKQQQTGHTIDPGDYEDELRRVRHYIAVHNVYGVDLNPVAVELGAPPCGSPPSTACAPPRPPMVE